MAGAALVAAVLGSGCGSVPGRDEPRAAPAPAPIPGTTAAPAPTSAPAPAPTSVPAPAPAPERFPPPPPLGLALLLPAPDDNPPTPEKTALGRRLFFDPVVSRDSSTACASCHLPSHAFADTLRFSRGVRGRTGARNAPALVNLAYGRSFFRDGRASSLEEAVLQPVENELELDLPIDSLIARLAADGSYRAAFRRAYGEVSAAAAAGALASYLRLVRSGDSPVDRFVAGDDNALPAAARRGRRLFLGKAGCAVCHSGPTFTDDGFHATGTAAESDDPGRAAVTGRKEDRGKFRTPTLREVARTAPYMHDGSLPDLEAVVRFYDGGGRPVPNLDPEIHPLGLTDAEVHDLVAFLRALSGHMTAPGGQVGRRGGFEQPGSALPRTPDPSGGSSIRASPEPL